MTGSVDFLPFAIGSGASVDSQADWATNGIVTNGFLSGILLNTLLNKALRQGSIGSAVLGNWIAQITGQNVQDNGVISTINQQLWLTSLMTQSFVDTGSANTIVIATPSGYTFPAPTKGINITVQVAATNTGATTLNWMGNGAVSVKTQSLAALTSGTLVANGYYNFIFDGTEWQLIA